MLLLLLFLLLTVIFKQRNRGSNSYSGLPEDFQTSRWSGLGAALYAAPETEVSGIRRSISSGGSDTDPSPSKHTQPAEGRVKGVSWQETGGTLELG